MAEIPLKRRKSSINQTKPICVSQTALCQGIDQGILSSLIKFSLWHLTLKLLYKQNLYVTSNRGAARGGAARGTRGAARGGPPTRGAPAGRGAPPARPAPPVPAPPPPPQRETYDEYAAPVRLSVLWFHVFIAELRLCNFKKVAVWIIGQIFSRKNYI